jgi:cytochrome P450
MRERSKIMSTSNLDSEFFSYDPFSFAVHDDPWNWYQVLRAHHPVYYNSDRKFWALSRFDDVQSAVRDWRTYSSGSGVELDGAPELYTELFGPGDFLNLDPEAHDRIRKVVHRAFTPKQIAILADAIRTQSISLVDDLVDSGGGDLARDLSWRMPLFGISQVVGFPVDDLVHLQDVLYQLLSRESSSDDPLPETARAAALEAKRYIRSVLAERRRQPRDDLLSVMVAAERDGELASNEVDGLCFLMFGAGMDTTATVLSTGISMLAAMPQERRMIASDPQRARRFNEEVTRHQCPVHGVARQTTREVSIHESHIPAGDWVWLIYASACRDERIYPEPAEFRVDRGGTPHLAFGGGIHHCIGAPLARLVGEIVFQEFCARVPAYETGPDVKLMHNHSVPRAVMSMPIAISGKDVKS